MSRVERKAMIQRDQPGHSLSRQCEILSISRSSFYYASRGREPGRTMSGALTSPTFRFSAAFCIWLRSWLGNTSCPRVAAVEHHGRRVLY